MESPSLKTRRQEPGRSAEGQQAEVLTQQDHGLTRLHGLEHDPAAAR